jgi:hypothetical protein
MKSKALLIICLAAFLVAFMGSAINPALPKIGEAFSMKAVSLSWIATSYRIDIDCSGICAMCRFVVCGKIIR